MTAIFSPVKVATISNLSSFTVGVPSSIDDVPLAINDRILVKAQTNPVENGIYVYSDAGGGNIALVRAEDFNDVVFASSIVFVQEGRLNADTGWLLASEPNPGNLPIAVGVSNLIFIRFTINPNVPIGESLSSSITLRRTNGGPLTNDQLDNNFLYLSDALIEKFDAKDFTAINISAELNKEPPSVTQLNANTVQGSFPSKAAADPNLIGQDTVVIRESVLNLDQETYTTYIKSNIFQGNLDGSAARLNNQLASFYLNVDNMNAGVLPLGRGGTGGNTAVTARTSLEALGVAGNEAMTGKLRLAPTSSAASLNLNPTGADITVSAVVGDIWAYNQNILYRVATESTKTFAYLESPTFITPYISENPPKETNSNLLASTKFTHDLVNHNVGLLQTAIDLKANVHSPTLTGSPIAPDIGLGTSSRIVTDNYLQSEFNLRIQNYYTKPEIDSRINTINSSIGVVDTKVNNALAQVGVPVGTVMMFAADVVPFGWLQCNGAKVNKTQFARLYQVLKSNRITAIYGEDATTFTLPDLRGEFLRGWDAGSGVDRNRAFGSWQRGTLTTFDPNYGSFNVTSVIARSNYSGASNGVSWADPDNATGRMGLDHVFAGKDMWPDMLRAEINNAPTPREIATSGWGYGMSRPRNVAMLPCIKAFGDVDNIEDLISAQDIINKANMAVRVDAQNTMLAGSTLILSRDPLSNLEAATKRYVDNKVSAIQLTPGPQGPTGPQGPAGPQGIQGPQGTTFTFTSGNTQYAVGATNIVGSWADYSNYLDVFPPAGKTMNNLIAFIPSIAVIHYAGGVDRNDSLRCTWSRLGDRIRVWVQNTEQRSTPAANWLAIWS